MKTFHFRLEQALRWRATQLDLEKSKLAGAVHQLARINEGIRSRDAERISGATQIAEGELPGEALTLWGAFTERSRREIAALQSKAREAETAVAAQTRVVVEADRRLRLLENLRAGAQKRWQADFNGELEAFAGESYLFRLQLKKQAGA